MGRKPIEINHKRCCHDATGEKPGLKNWWRRTHGQCCHEHPDGSLDHIREYVDNRADQLEDRLDIVEEKLRILAPDEFDPEVAGMEAQRLRGRGRTSS